MDKYVPTEHKKHLAAVKDDLAYAKVRAGKGALEFEDEEEATQDVKGRSGKKIRLRKKVLKKTMRLQSSDREQFDVLLSIKKPRGKQRQPFTRASLVEKMDVGC